MNLLLLLAGAQPWNASSSLDRLTRVFAAISVLSVEMQLVTWLQVGSLRSLPAVNVVVAVVAFVAWRPSRRLEPRSLRLRDAVPLAAALILGALVVILNLGLPLTAADPYHLEKVERIARLGTLAYDPAALTKINILNSLYETLLADLRSIPAIGPLAIRLHGLWGLLWYLVAIAAARELLAVERPAVDGTRRNSVRDAAPALPARWPWATLLAVPVVFHQLVLIKNDLLVAVLGLVVLMWVVVRSGTARWPEMVWAAWLAGLAVAIKLTTLPLLAVLGGACIVQRRLERRTIAALALGTLIGAMAGGLLFTLVEDLRVYGHLLPTGDQETPNVRVASMLVGLARFGISLVDFGLVTPILWPGRGGWGSTFGLPFIWACAVLAWSYRHSAIAQRALFSAAVYFLCFAAVFPDADLAHRLALAPALLLIAVAVSELERRDLPRALRRALVPVLVLSSAQIIRSAVLYFMR